MYIGVCQVIMLAIIILNLGIDLVKHGEAKQPREHNFFATLLASGIELTLLWFGGFFK